MHLLLQVVSTSGNGGDATQLITDMAKTVEGIALTIVGALASLVVVIFLMAKMIGALMHMWGSMPWAARHQDLGAVIHRRANTAIIKLLIETPVIIAIAVLVGAFVARLTGFSIPLTFPTIPTPGH
jgi:hypothetical protein